MPRLLALVVLLVVVGCAGPAVTPTLVATFVPTAVPGGATPAATLGERVVGGFAVIHERSQELAGPSLTAEQATAITRDEIAAGRATIVAFGAGIPAMRTLDVSFSPALVDVINPAGGPTFQSPAPVAAWVVVLRGQGVDGEYTTIGVVEDATGRPLVTQVWTPGAG